MNVQEFTGHFAEQFDNTPPDQINPETAFRSLEEWDSLIALSIMAMVDEIYGVKLTGDEMRAAQTVQQLFETVSAKKG